MSGEAFDRPAARMLEEAGLRKARRAAVGEDLVESLVARAEGELDACRPLVEGRAHWIAGRVLVRPAAGDTARLTWAYRGEARELVLDAEAAAAAARTIGALARGVEGRPFSELSAELSGLCSLGPESIRELRESGLAVV